MKKLLLLFMMLAMAIPLWAGLQTVTINRNDGQFEEANGVYYCYKSGLMMTFTSGLNNPNYLVEHQQVYFEVRSVNPEYIIKKIVFHCVDNTTSDNLDCFYWGPSTISIVQNFYNQSAPGTYRYSGYTGTWTGETNKIQFTTMAKPVRFGSVDITFEKETGDIFELVTDESQLQAGHKYAIVNQYYPTNAENEGYAMSTLMNETYNTIGRTKVSFVPNTNKHKVIINDETRIITLQTGTNVDDRPWYLGSGSSTVKMRRASSTSGSAVSAKGYVLSYENIGSYPEFFPVKIEIGAEADNYPAKIRFCDNSANYNKPTDTNYAIGHNNNYEYFKVLDITSSNTYASTQRVHLYSPAQNYNITTEVIPTDGGEITLTDGVLEVNGNQTSQESQQVSFYVGINEGYAVESVTVTDAGNNPITVECTQTTLQGNRYTFTMPGANVHIVVRYTQANYHVIHAECTPTYGGEYTFNSGTFDMSDQVVSFADNTVNFGITASLGYVFTGITATSQDGQSTVLPLTDNGDGTYSFTMPDNDVTLSASFDRVIGDIFDLVTSGAQIVEGSTYIIVTQNHDKVMKHWNKTDGTFQGAPIVEWVTQDKTKVRVDDNACFFRMDDLVVNSSNNYRSAYMNTLVGYLGYGEYNGTTGKVIATPDRSGYNRATMYISGASNASNYLCTFDSIKTPNRTIRYEAATNSFKIINYGNSTDERVWLYKLAESYHNISTVCTPPEGGSINVNATSAQADETVTFTVTTNEGYTFDGVTVTYTDGTQGTITVTENNGEYSFTMPDNAVTISAGFTVIPVGYVIDSERIPEAGGYVNINNSGNNATANAMPGETVNVYVGTNWGYRIASVTAVNTTSGETVTLTTGTTSDAGNNYSFTMPVGNVHITAKFYRNLFLIGTVMGRTTWCAAGPEFTFDPENDEYYLDVYFKGLSGNDPYGYFNLATATDSGTDWTNRNINGGDWNQVNGSLRLFAATDNLEVGNGSTATLYSDNEHRDYSFKIPAGIYRITVNHAMDQMTITQTYPTMTFDPVSGSSIQLGSEVHITSDLQTLVHALAQRYGMHDNNNGPAEQTAVFYTTTDDWATQVEQQQQGIVTINELGTTTVTSSAAIGQIIVNGQAVYEIVPKVYTIEAICNPEAAGTITVASTAHQGDLITFTVGTEPDYVLSSVLIYNNSDPTAQPITPTDNGNGSYSFTMPDYDVVIMANFDLKTYDITTVCDPVQGGTITLEGTAADGNEVPNQTVTMTVDANLGFKVTDVTVQQDGTTTPVDVTDNGDGTYSFTMPEGDVTVTAHYELEGVIFKLVTDPSEIVEGEYYTIVNQKYDRVLNNIAPGAATNFYSSTNIVEWASEDKSFVKLDGNACFFSPEDVTDYNPNSYSLYRSGYLKTSGGYIGREPNVENNEYGHLALFGSKDDVKPFTMSVDVLGSGSLDHYAYIYYDHEVDGNFPDEWQVFFDIFSYFEYNSFLLENTTLSHYDTWLYKPAKMYNITTVVNPDGTESSLELDGGAVGNMGAEGSTIVVWPVAGEGYALSSLVVTIDGTGEVVEATPNIDGSYSFIMPSNDVTITATFTTGYHINWVCDPEDTGEIIVTSTAYAGQHVAFEVLPYDDYEVSGITITIDGDDDEIPYEENEDGTYSFYMPDDHVTIKATLVLHSEVATLQYIEQYDTYYSDTRVTVSDELIGAWRAKQYLWVKDQAPQCSNVYLEKESEETFDFLRECIRRDVSLNGDQSKLIMWQPREWDQSNWAMLDFSKLFPKDAEPDEFGEYQSWSQVRYNEMRNAMQQFVDNKIAAHSITGTYYCKGEPDENWGDLFSYPKVQHVIVLDKLPDPVTPAETSLGYPGYVEDPIEVKNYPADPSKYMYNHYMSYNFNTQNLGHTWLPEDVMVYWYEQTGEDPETDYFFMNPKDQEVAQVCGVYLGRIGEEVTDVFYDEQGDLQEETITLSAGDDMDFTSGDLFGAYKFDPENGINHYGWTGTFLVPNEGDINDWSDWNYYNGWSCNGWQFNRLNYPVDDEYKLEESYGRPGPGPGIGELVPGEGYIFHAVIQYTPTEPGGPRAPRRGNQRQGTPDYRTEPKFYLVYPLDMMSRDDNFTHVKEVKSQEASLIKSITYYNLMGQESKTPFEGINIEVIRYQDGSMISRKILR